MKLTELPISWVDFVTALVLLVGIVRGRKRGLSEELLDTLQWLFIVVAAAYCYRQLGALISVKPVLSPVAYLVTSYIMIALVVKLLFSLVKRRIGQKLIEGDAFGRFEYYLGMAAGSLRFACVYLFLLSILHAPHYSPEYRAAKEKSDSYNYGDIRFPTVMSIQDEVFTRSLTGKSADKYLAMLLIEPTTTSSKPLRGENSMAKRRERDIDVIFSGK